MTMVEQNEAEYVLSARRHKTVTVSLTSPDITACQLCGGDACAQHAQQDKQVANKVDWRRNASRRRRRFSNKQVQSDSSVTSLVIGDGYAGNNEKENHEEEKKTIQAERKYSKKLSTSNSCDELKDVTLITAGDTAIRKKSYSEALSSGLTQKLTVSSTIVSSSQSIGKKRELQTDSDGKETINDTSVSQSIPNNIVKSRNDISCRRSHIHSYAGKLSNVDLQWNDLHRTSPINPGRNWPRPSSPADEGTDSSDSMTDCYPSSASDGLPEELSQEELDYLTDFAIGPSLIGFSAGTPPVFSPSYSCSPPTSAALYNSLYPHHFHGHHHHHHHHTPSSPLYTSPAFCDSPSFSSWPPPRFTFPDVRPRMTSADVAYRQLNNGRHHSSGGNSEHQKMRIHQRTFSSSSQPSSSKMRTQQRQFGRSTDGRRKRASSCTADFKDHNVDEAANSNMPSSREGGSTRGSNNVLVDLTNSNLSSSYSVFGSGSASHLLKSAGTGYVHFSCNFYVPAVLRSGAVLQPCYIPVSTAPAAAMPFPPSPTSLASPSHVCCTGEHGPIMSYGEPDRMVSSYVNKTADGTANIDISRK